MLPHAETSEYGRRFETGVPVAVRFLRNTGKAPSPPPVGDPYQQRIEPAGRYMIHNPDPGELPRGWEQGEVRFENPLVLWFNLRPGQYYDDGSWKKLLSKHYGGKRGLQLSKAIVRSGHDAVITVMPGAMDTREIVDLTWLRGRA